MEDELKQAIRYILTSNASAEAQLVAIAALIDDDVRNYIKQQMTRN